MRFTPRVKFWLWTSAVTALVLGLCGWLYWFVDGPEPDDADVRWPAPGPLPPPGQNGYLLVEAWPSDYIQDRLAKIEEEASLYWLLSGYEWRDSSARRLDAECSELRERLRAAMSKPHFAAPVFKTWYEHPVAPKMRESIYACLLSAQIEFRNDNPGKALDWIELADTAIRRMAYSGEGRVALATAQMLWGLETELLLFQAPWAKLGPADLHRISQLGYTEEEGLRFHIEHLHAWHEEFTRALIQSKAQGNFEPIWGRGRPTPVMMGSSRSLRLLLVNDTRQMHAKWVRDEIAHGLAETHKDSAKRYEARMTAVAGLAKDYPWLKIARRNLPGFIIFLDSFMVRSLRQAGIPWASPYEEYHRYLNFGMSSLHLLAALRRYELDHGALPAKPQDLLPGYLAAWPADPYDLKPLRYSARSRRIWSVGITGMDSGGNDPADYLDDDARRRLYFSDNYQPTVPVFPTPLAAPEETPSTSAPSSEDRSTP